MYKFINKCICCDNPNLFVILDLGEQPLANNFHNNTKQIDSYELKLMGCHECWHTQLSIEVDRELLFTNYLYTSGTSKTLKQYFDAFTEKYNQINAGNVLEIACNDGSQLDSFKLCGWNTFGVDPAKNLYPISSKKGHTIICDFWCDEVASQLPNMDLVVAQNVFAHTTEVNKFLQSCKLCMKENTKLIIQTSQANMFDNNEFDTIYHEHVSFFSVHSMKTICERNGLVLNKVYKTDIHGTSFVFEIGLTNDQDGSVTNNIELEKNKFTRTFFKNYGTNAINCLNALKKFVKDKEVIGYGAAAKGMTVLNAGNIKLKYIVDDSPTKQGLFTPGTNIPIVGKEKLLTEMDNLIILPLAWNFYEEIRERVKTIRPNKTDLFIRYFPELST